MFNPRAFVDSDTARVGEADNSPEVDGLATRRAGVAGSSPAREGRSETSGSTDGAIPSPGARRGKPIRRRPLYRFVQAVRLAGNARGHSDAKLVDLLEQRELARSFWWHAHTGFTPSRPMIRAAAEAIRAEEF